MKFHLEDYMLPCLNKKLFGVDCLGCGMQRSFLYVLQGNFTAAFKMYPAIFTLIILASYILLNIKFKFKKSKIVIRNLIIINLVIIIISYIIKMRT